MLQVFLPDLLLPVRPQNHYLTVARCHTTNQANPRVAVLLGEKVMNEDNDVKEDLMFSFDHIQSSCMRFIGRVSSQLRGICLVLMLGIA